MQQIEAQIRRQEEEEARRKKEEEEQRRKEEESQRQEEENQKTSEAITEEAPAGSDEKDVTTAPTEESTQETTTAPAETSAQETTTAPAEESTQETTTAPAEENTQETTTAPAETSTQETTVAPTETSTQETTAAPTETSAPETTTAPTEANGGSASKPEEPSAITFQWPIPASSRITSPFGNRKAPLPGMSDFHKGVDVGAKTGTKIYAAAAGTVVISQYNYSAGNYIMISHGDGIYTVYMHCSKLLVEVGDKVEQGDNIGLVGSTGYSTAPHLHFGVRVNGEYKDPLNYVSVP